MWRIVGGVIVGLVSSCLNALSYVVQKKAHLLNARSNRPIYKHPVWLIGFGLLLLGSIISLVTMGFLDQTTLSSLSSVTIVLSIVFSSLCLKEAFTRWVFLQLVLMLTGASLMLVFSNKVQREFTLDDMLFLYKRPIATIFLIAYTCMFLVLTLYAFVIIKRVLRIKKVYDESMERSGSDQNTASTENYEFQFSQSSTEETQRTEEAEVAEDTSQRAEIETEPEPRRGYKKTQDLIEFVSQVPKSELRGYLKHRWLVKLPQIAFPWFGGYLSGLTTLFFKTFVEMTKTADQFDNFKDAFPFVILVSGLAALVLTLIMLNKGLKYFNAIDTVPIYESSVILHNISCGGIVLNEFSTLKTKNIILFAVGAALVIVGIFILIKKKDDRNRKKFTRRALLESQHDTHFASSSPPAGGTTDKLALEEPLTPGSEEDKN